MKHLISFFLFIFLFAGNASAQLVKDSTTAKLSVIAISSTDHLTRKTDLSSLTCYRNKNGTSAACGGSSVELSDSNNPGEWVYTLDATDVDTAGLLTLTFSASGMDTATIGPFFVSEGVNVTSVKAGVIEPGDFAADGVLASVDGTTIGLASGHVDADDQFNNGWRIDFRGADRQGSSCITDSTNSGDTVVIADTLSPAPTTGDGYVIYSDATCDPALLTSINAEMLDVLSTDENAELAALPGASPTILEMLQFTYEYLRNKIAVTSSSETVYKNDSSTAIGERTLADNGTTFSKTRVETP